MKIIIYNYGVMRLHYCEPQMEDGVEVGEKDEYPFTINNMYQQAFSIAAKYLSCNSNDFPDLSGSEYAMHRYFVKELLMVNIVGDREFYQSAFAKLDELKEKSDLSYEGVDLIVYHIRKEMIDAGSDLENKIDCEYDAGCAAYASGKFQSYREEKTKDGIVFHGDMDVEEDIFNIEVRSTFSPQ